MVKVGPRRSVGGSCSSRGVGAGGMSQYFYCHSPSLHGHCRHPSAIPSIHSIENSKMTVVVVAVVIVVVVVVEVVAVVRVVVIAMVIHFGNRVVLLLHGCDSDDEYTNGKNIPRALFLCFVCSGVSSSSSVNGVAVAVLIVVVVAIVVVVVVVVAVVVVIAEVVWWY